MNEKNIEIERKYIIKLPKLSVLEAMSEYTKSEIVQIYLTSPKGITHRIRRREKNGVAVYTETTKVRIDGMSAYEDEREITEADFEALKKKAALHRRPVKKIRHTFVYKKQLFEIDVYPEWDRQAIMETELESREAVVEFPAAIEIIREVTGDKRYSNAAMSKEFPTPIP